MFKANNRHQNDANSVVLVSLLLTLNIFDTYSGVFIVNFKQVNSGWVPRFLTCKISFEKNKSAIEV